MNNNSTQGVAWSRQNNIFRLKPLSQHLALAQAALLGFVCFAPLQVSAATVAEPAQ